MQKQLAYMLGRQEIFLELPDDLEEFDELTEIMSNAHLNNNFLALAREVCISTFLEKSNCVSTSVAFNIINTVKPFHAVTCIKRSPFSCPVIENFIRIKPILRGHLSYKATFSLSQR